MDHESDNDGNETDKKEEEVIGLVQMGENFLGQINQGKGLEEQNKDEDSDVNNEQVFKVTHTTTIVLQQRISDTQMLCWPNAPIKSTEKSPYKSGILHRRPLTFSSY